MVKRTLREIANFFDMAVAMDADGHWYFYESRPSLDKARRRWCSDDKFVPKPDLFDFSYYSGDWRESLTLPDNWPKEPPFKEGEIVYGLNNNGPYVMTLERLAHEYSYRKPTEAEWKRLRGEER